MTTKIEFSYIHKNGTNPRKTIQETTLYQDSTSYELKNAKAEIEKIVSVIESINNEKQVVTLVRVVDQLTNQLEEFRLSAGNKLTIESEIHRLKIQRQPF